MQTAYSQEINNSIELLDIKILDRLEKESEKLYEKIDGKSIETVLGNFHETRIIFLEKVINILEEYCREKKITIFHLDKIIKSSADVEEEYCEKLDETYFFIEFKEIKNISRFIEVGFFLVINVFFH